MGRKKTLSLFRMDLHIHTCLSPCGCSEMVPTRIIEKALQKRLDLIGVCDHNASENYPAVKRAAEKSGVRVLGGIEVTSKEEIHILALFGCEQDLNAMQKIVYAHLRGVNDSDAFGEQYIVDQNDYVKGINRRLLIGSTDISLEETVAHIHECRGIAIASHIDRDAFSIISQLGFIPEGLALDAVELAFGHSKPSAFSGACRYPVLRFSDAHFLRDIGAAHTKALLAGPTIEELRKALGGKRGRRILAE
jgi:PHP family Zn ribbon phosphoesterase